MKNLTDMKNLPKKISSKNLTFGVLFGVACVAGMFLDSEGAIGWLALGVGLLAALGCALMQIMRGEKMEGNDNDD